MCVVFGTFGERNSGKPRIEALNRSDTFDRTELSACHDFTRFFKLFDHCFDFLTQIRRHAVHLIMGAEKETEADSAVANTDLVTRRPAKLRLRPPSKTKQTTLCVCRPRRSHGVTCIRKWNKYLLRLSRLRNWKL